MKFFIGIVTTTNRKHYLKQLLDSIEATKFKDAEHEIFVVTDVHKHGVGTMRNILLEQADKTNFDFGFLMDDDIYMTKPGWDNLYYAYSKLTGFPHLCYFNATWLKHHSGLTLPINVWQSMGCLHTFTPEVIKKIGYYDVANFGKHGAEHWDWSARACRAGFNNKLVFLDAPNSNDYVGMQMEDYKAAWEGAPPTGDMGKKLSIARDESRLYIPLQ